MSVKRKVPAYLHDYKLFPKKICSHGDEQELFFVPTSGAWAKQGYQEERRLKHGCRSKTGVRGKKRK